MKSWAEVLLALAIMLALGAGFWLFTGQSLSDATPDTAGPVVADTEAALRGEIVAADNGCQACHTVDGTPGTGPTWKGLAGSSRPLESGDTVIADDAYLTRSIEDPMAQIVAGFAPVMPETYSSQLNGDEISDLVEYIKSLAS